MVLVRFFVTVEFGRGGRGRKKKHRGTGGGLRVLVLVLALVLFRQGAGEARANLKHHSDLSESDRSEWCLRFAPLETATGFMVFSRGFRVY